MTDTPRLQRPLDESEYTVLHWRLIHALGLNAKPDEVHLGNGYVHHPEMITRVIFSGDDLLAIRIVTTTGEEMTIPWESVLELRWQ